MAVTEPDNTPRHLGAPPIAQTCRFLRTEALKQSLRANNFYFCVERRLQRLEELGHWIEARIKDGSWAGVASLDLCSSKWTRTYIEDWMQRRLPHKKVDVRESRFLLGVPRARYKVIIEDV